MQNQSPYSVSVPVSVTTSGAGYVAGDCVGGIISLPNIVYTNGGTRAVLRSIQINDKGGVAPSLNIYFFKATPSGGTYTDNAQVVWGTGDSANKVGVVNVLNSNYLTDISQSAQNLSGIVMKMPVGVTTLFMLIVSEGSYTIANGNLTIDCEMDQE